jgi:hypothetical protein
MKWTVLPLGGFPSISFSSPACTTLLLLLLLLLLTRKDTEGDNRSCFYVEAVGFRQIVERASHAVFITPHHIVFIVKGGGISRWNIGVIGQAGVVLMAGKLETIDVERMEAGNATDV